MKQKRGQAATEFFMTYGWAIVLLVLAIATLIVIGVFQRDISTSCDVDEPFSCQDAFITENAIVLKIAAKEFGTAQVESITINDQPCPKIIGREALTPEGLTTVRCLGISLTEEQQLQAEVKIKYKKLGSIVIHTARGIVTGQALPTEEIYQSSADITASYDFEGDTLDLSGNGQNPQPGTALDCNEPGVKGNACFFDGVTYLTVPHSQTLIVNQITVSTWIKPQIGSPDAGIVSKAGSGWWLTYDTDQEINFYVNEMANKCSAPAPANQWSYIAVTYDGENIRCYVNKELTQTTPYTGGILNSVQPMLIGARENSPFTGTIDQLVIYNKALTAEAIRENFEGKIPEESGTPTPPPDEDRRFAPTPEPYGETEKN